MKKLIKKVIKLSEMKHEKKESWLDNIKDWCAFAACIHGLFDMSFALLSSFHVLYLHYMKKKDKI